MVTTHANSFSLLHLNISSLPYHFEEFDELLNSLHNNLCYRTSRKSPQTKCPTSSKAMCSWSFIHSHFLCKNLNVYVLIIWLFFEICLEFSLLGFSKAGSNTRKYFKNNVIKWETKQSWKGNIWKCLFIISIFFTLGRK